MAPILATGQLIGNRYEVWEQLKHYKDLYKCFDTKHDNKELILKVEQIKDRNRLETEFELYKKLSTAHHFDIVVDYLSDKSFRYLLMRPLGVNLHDFMKKKRSKNQTIDLELIVRYADEMISRLTNCHLRNIIHRDIKPENFVVDTDNDSHLYLIDFNLAKEFADVSGGHIVNRRKGIAYSVGNVQFMSIHAHDGNEQSRRDDLISVGYTLVYLANDGLPWSQIRSNMFSTRLDHMKAVHKIKQNCSVDELCVGLPEAFRQYMNYCLNLEFDERPNYFQLRKYFSDSLPKINSLSVMCPVIPPSQPTVITLDSLSLDDLKVVTKEPEDNSMDSKHKFVKTRAHIMLKISKLSPPLIGP
ncbi:casein kinase I-like [Oppia nitens]|uniref:casein kinase I-like n=1 Tax=Oppia nitens TaxID=1686743 RepID=UPI0023DA0598|nr:casein kinase I-like [Oppia nitens]